MELDKKSADAVKAFNEDPTEQRNVYALGSIYWSVLVGATGERIRNGEDVGAFLSSESDFVDFGLLDGVIADIPALRARINQGNRSDTTIEIHLAGEWLQEAIARILSGDKKELLEHDIKNTERQLDRLRRELESIQQSREQLLHKELSDELDRRTTARINDLCETDALQMQNLLTRRGIKKGIFLSVVDRREFVQREDRLRKENAETEVLFSRVKSKEARKALRELSTRAAAVFEKTMDSADAISMMESRIGDIEKMQFEISPLEMENRTREEIEYLRDLVKLSARRLHMECCPILRPNDKHFTIDELTACVNRILEFDPRVFRNDRVPVFGRPSVLLVPGNGNSLYDWKHNRLVVPLAPPGGNFMASVASAIIEYRLDVDDDKLLVNSYSKLPDMKNVHSIVALRTALTRDYIRWMTAEYQGYKVLNKETRKWFEHEIAPSRNEIFCPPEYQQFALGATRYRALLKDTVARLGQNLADSDENDLWIASILFYQQGEFEKAFHCLESLLARNADHVFAHYNLGLIGMKVSRKQEAVAGFKEFRRRNPQTWWAGVARDHARRLQAA